MNLSSSTSAAAKDIASQQAAAERLSAKRIAGQKKSNSAGVEGSEPLAKKARKGKPMFEVGPSQAHSVVVYPTLAAFESALAARLSCSSGDGASSVGGKGPVDFELPFLLTDPTLAAGWAASDVKPALDAFGQIWKTSPLRLAPGKAQQKNAESGGAAPAEKSLTFFMSAALLPSSGKAERTRAWLQAHPQWQQVWKMRFSKRMGWLRCELLPSALRVRWSWCPWWPWPRSFISISMPKAVF